MSFLKGFGVAFAAVVAVGIIACGGGGSSGGASGDDKACTDGDKKACEKVLSTLKAECDKSNASSCARLGLEYISGKDVRKKYKDIGFFDEKAVPKGIVERDELQALVNITRACDLNHAFACLMATEIAPREKRKEFLTKSANISEKECDSGNDKSCALSGLLYGEMKDFFKAKTPLHKYCDKVEKTDNDMTHQACRNLGDMYMKGEGVAQDIEKAKVYFKKVCEGGDQSGCDRFKNANEKTMK